MYSKISNFDNNVAREVHRKLGLVHLALRRALQRIAAEASQVLPKDRDDFILYCKIFRDCVMDHHHHEDAFLFPFCAEHCQLEDALKNLDEQHNDIMSSLAAFSLSVQLSVKTFDGKKVAKAASNLQAHLVPHLEAEESIFTEEVLARAPASELGNQLAKVDAHITSTNPFKQLPFLVHNLTNKEAEDLVFRGEPWFFRNVSFPLFWSRVYNRAWKKFASHPKAEGVVA